MKQLQLPMKSAPFQHCGVTISEDKGRLWVTSMEISDKFGKRHGDVLRSIDGIIKDCPVDFGQRNFASTSYLDEHNREQPLYTLTREGFALVVMGFTGKKAIEWKVKFLEAFSAMERHILQSARRSERHAQVEWQQARAQGKLSRREETDGIKAFVEYAKAQGSKSAEKYYMNITKMTYKALFVLEQGLKGSDLREFMHIRDLVNLGAAENIVSKALQDGMEKGMFYKDIYQFAKQRLESFASMIGVSALYAIQPASQLSN